MRIIFAGTPALAVPSLTGLISRGHEVVGVLTREDAPVGRKRVLTPSPVAEEAATRGIPTLKANRLDEAAARWIGGLDTDLGVIVAYGALLREPILSLPRLGWINLHFSDLPRYRGAAPVQRALMAGERRLGLTVFRLTPGLDDGPVLSRGSKQFAPGTAADIALEELGAYGVETLATAIAALDADPGAGEPQSGESTYAHKLSREDGRLDLGLPPERVLAHWAGVTTEPGAWVMCEGTALKVLELREAATDGGGLSPGGGVARLVGGRAMLLLPTGALELVRVQPAGKPAMDAAAWLRGRGGEAALE